MEPLLFTAPKVMKRNGAYKLHSPTIKQRNDIHFLPSLKVAVLVLIEEPEIVSHLVIAEFVVCVHNIVLWVIDVSPVQSREYLPSYQFKTTVDINLNILCLTEVQGRV